MVDEPGGQWRAIWDRENPNKLKVFATHPTLERYLGNGVAESPEAQPPHFRILLAEIVSDKLVQRILEEKIKVNPALFDDPNLWFFLYTEEMTSFLPEAHRIMISDSEAKKLLAA